MHKNPSAALLWKEKLLSLQQGRDSCSASSLITPANEEPGGVKQEKEPAASCSKGWAEAIAAPSSWLGVDVGQICFPEHRLGFGWPQRGPRLQLLAWGKAKLAQVAEESFPSQGAKPQCRSFPLENTIPSKPKRFTKIKAILAEVSFGGEKENKKIK